MSDIVERLRSVGRDYDFHENAYIYEAADEIERLRDENKRLAKSRDKWGQRYNQTLEKLRHAVMSDSEYCKAIDDENERLRAQNAALREALETYACDCLIGECVDGFQSCGSRARAALSDAFAPASAEPAP